VGSLEKQIGRKEKLKTLKPTNAVGFSYIGDNMINIATIGTSWITRAFIGGLDLLSDIYNLSAVYSRSKERGEELENISLQDVDEKTLEIVGSTIKRMIKNVYKEEE
jgi:hypothetical protein